MKVLFTFYVQSGGVETLNRLRTIELFNHGVEAHVLYQSSPSGGSRSHHAFTTFITPYEEDLHTIIHTHQYDAIVVTSDYIMVERLRRLGFTKPIIFEAQGLGTRSQAMQVLIEGNEILRQHATAALSPPTSHLVELITGLCPWLPRFIFPNPVDTKLFQYRPTGPSERAILAWIGRLEANKNWREFLEIGYQVIRHHPHTDLWMFIDVSLSPDHEINSFHQELTRLDLYSHIKTLSHIPYLQMPYYYSLISDSGGMLISTSILEGFGYVIAEAMSCECPVLSTDSDGVRSFIIPEVTGKFYSQGNVQHGVTQALTLMNDKAVRSKIRSQARHHMSTSYSTDQYVRSFKEMMNALGIC